MPLESLLFFEISIVIITAAILAIIAKFLKQPIILGYIATGVILGPIFLNVLFNKELIEVLSTIGITFLLFLVGLELNPKKLKEIGKISSLAGFAQIIITGGLGYLIAKGFSFGTVESIYIAIALTFSSTIIVIKVLSGKRTLESMHGKLAIGILLVQDFVAIIVLIAINSFGAQNASLDYSIIVFTLLKSCLFLGFTIVSGKFILQPIFSKIARHQELLFITSISWCLLFGVISLVLDFPIEIGAFLAGISLSTLPYSLEISAKIRPLRDFFITLFFVALGSKVIFSSAAASLGPLVVLSLFVVLGTPLIIMVIMGFYGYRVRTSFKTGIALAQISEFSFIVTELGVRNNHINENLASLIAVIGIVTITFSTYLMEHDDKLFKMLHKPLKIFQRKNTHQRVKKITRKLRDHIVIIGFDRIGRKIINSFEKRKQDILVIDYNPRFINYLENNDIHCLYGDVKNLEILENAELEDAQVIICTIPYFDVNIALLDYIKKNEHIKAPVVLTAKNAMDCLELYKQGADYVLFSYSISADYFTNLLHQDIKSKKSKHVTELKKILQEETKLYKRIV